MMFKAMFKNVNQLHKLLLSCLLVMITAAGAYAQKKITVAADGSGNFTTVQAAVDAVPGDHNGFFVIHIKAGTYKERLVISKSKSFIHFIGDDPATTKITFDNYASKKDSAGKDYGTSGSSSVFVDGNDITFENLCFENSSGPVGQAVAVNTTGSRIAFKNCRLLGYQDTLYTKGSNAVLYFKDCFITGTVDYIFGSSAALFENCTLHSIGKGGYVTAASTPEGSKFGYVFLKCKLTSETPPSSVLLGRPWRPFAKVVYIECAMDEHIKAEGWNNWGKVDNEKTAFSTLR